MIELKVSRLAIAGLIAATAGVLLAGCGPVPSAGPAVAGRHPGGAAAAGATAPNPCSLVTEAEATTAIGAAAGPGVPGGSSDVPRCTYGNGALIIDASSQGRAEYDSQHAAMTSGPAGSSREVSGVGDAAFEVSGGPTAIVMFAKGSTLVEIILQGSLSAPADAGITLASAAAGRA